MVSFDLKTIRRFVFRYRSYTPIPFLLIAMIFAQPTIFGLIVGFALIALGESIRLWAVSVAGVKTRSTRRLTGMELVATGPFAYVRNLMYLANIVIYFGVGIMSNALFPWLLLAVLLWFPVQYYVILTYEEEFL